MPDRRSTMDPAHHRSLHIEANYYHLRKKNPRNDILHPSLSHYHVSHLVHIWPSSMKNTRRMAMIRAYGPGRITLCEYKMLVFEHLVYY